MSDSRFDEIVFLGDFLDMPGLARFSVGKAKILSELDLEGDYQVAAELLYKTVDILRKNNRNAKVTFLQGNHEQRVERFAEEVPQFSRLLSVPTLGTPGRSPVRKLPPKDRPGRSCSGVL